MKTKEKLNLSLQMMLNSGSFELHKYGPPFVACFWQVLL